jgi:hypothetical protein
LREIPADMFLCEGHLLCLKVQRNLPDLLTISLLPFFSQFSTKGGVAISNRVTGSLIDLVQQFVVEPSDSVMLPPCEGSGSLRL